MYIIIDCEDRLNGASGSCLARMRLGRGEVVSCYQFLGLGCPPAHIGHALLILTGTTLYSGILAYLSTCSTPPTKLFTIASTKWNVEKTTPRGTLSVTIAFAVIAPCLASILMSSPPLLIPSLAASSEFISIRAPGIPVIVCWIPGLRPPRSASDSSSSPPW